MTGIKKMPIKISADTAKKFAKKDVAIFFPHNDQNKLWEEVFGIFNSWKYSDRPMNESGLKHAMHELNCKGFEILKSEK